MTDAAPPASAAGPLAWFRELGNRERRTFWACFFGWGLDAMDAQLYSFVIPTLIVIWGLTNAEAGLLSTVTLLLSALGGWLAGFLSDRIGRVRTLQITVLWFSVFTFLSGLAQNFEQLFAARALMGLGFGGEWAAGSVLMGEVIRARHRGKAVGTVQSAWAIGWGIAALAYTVAFSLLPETLAWRVLFLIGILPAGLIFYIRRFVDEPEVFKEAQSAAAGDRPGFGAIFKGPVLRTTILAALLSTGAQGGYYAVTTWLPTYLKTVKGLSVLNTGGYLAVIIVGSFCGYVVSAYLSDRIGRRPNFFVFALGSLVVVIAYTGLDFGNGVMLVLGFPLGFFASGVFSGMGPFFTELFPTSIRGAGQGFAYNCGRGIGALFPSLVGTLSAVMPLGQAIGVFAASAYALMFLAAVMLPETRGRELTAR